MLFIPSKKSSDLKGHKGHTLIVYRGAAEIDLYIKKKKEILAECQHGVIIRHRVDAKQLVSIGQWILALRCHTVVPGGRERETDGLTDRRFDFLPLTVSDRLRISRTVTAGRAAAAAVNVRRLMPSVCVCVGLASSRCAG